jgi:hypothetical protein
MVLQHDALVFCKEHHWTPRLVNMPVPIMLAKTIEQAAKSEIFVPLFAIC